MVDKKRTRSPGFAEREHIHLLKAMVRLAERNRKLREEKKHMKMCPHCKAKGKPYRKRDHPKNQDCAGTGVATTWR